MEDQRFELFCDTVYTLIPLLKRTFLLPDDSVECGSVTKSHFPLLFTLHSSGTMTMTEAAKKACCSKPHMTLQVERLVEEGLMERLTGAEDRRLIAIRLTKKGNECVQHLKEMMKQKAWALFSTLSDDTLEKTLNALLTLKEVMIGSAPQAAPPCGRDRGAPQSHARRGTL